MLKLFSIWISNWKLICNFGKLVLKQPSYSSDSVALQIHTYSCNNINYNFRIRTLLFLVILLRLSIMFFGGNYYFFFSTHNLQRISSRYLMKNSYFIKYLLSGGSNAPFFCWGESRGGEFLEFLKLLSFFCSYTQKFSIGGILKIF